MVTDTKSKWIARGMGYTTVVEKSIYICRMSIFWAKGLVSVAHMERVRVGTMWLQIVIRTGA